MTRLLNVGEIGIAREELPPFDRGPIDVRAWFGPAVANQPLDLEIGSGKGTFLVQEALRTPAVNHIGIEWARAYWRHAADRCRRRGLRNVRLVQVEAAMFVRCYVADAVFRQVHVYFPDPWPKTRHHKRRLIQEPFLRQLHRILEPAGLVRLATDHDLYFSWMQGHAARTHHLFEMLPFAPLESAGDDELVGTNFERKYRRQGRPFYAMLLRKRSRGTIKATEATWNISGPIARPVDEILDRSSL